MDFQERIMTPIEIRNAFREIGIALNLTHNTVTTDIVGVEPDETHWRVDNSKEIALLEKLRYELSNIDIDLECECYSKSP